MCASLRAVFGAILLLLATPNLAMPAEMADVRRALAEQRLFDAFVDLQDLAAGGNAEAQFELAGFHHYGRVGPVNFKKALDWYLRSANQGYVDAMIGLAVLYGHGQGVARDPELAYQWLLTAQRMQPPPKETDARVIEAMAALRPELSTEQQARAELAAASFVPKPE